EKCAVKALYDYQAVDSKVLNFQTNDRFIVIKHSNEWLYVINGNGQLGYVPANYVQQDSFDDQQLLVFVDAVIALLDVQRNDCNTITVRQVNHAKVCPCYCPLLNLTHLFVYCRKLAQIRCEVVQRVCHKNNDTVNLRVNGDTNEDTEDDEVQKFDVSIQTDTFQETPQEPSSKCNDIEERLEVPNDVATVLVERIRVETELSHNMCILTAETVIKCLKEMIPNFEVPFNEILQKLNDESLKCLSPDVMRQSSDLKNLNLLFRKLWFCKNDEQQRSWPVHEDEQIIESYLQDIAKVFINANPSISRGVICANGYDNVHMLVTYFQMETRRILRMKLYTILLEAIRLEERVISDYMLNSVLPSTLADEMLNYSDDVDRFANAAALFTAIFSSGHKPPINLYEHVNENFIDQLLKLIEGEDFNGQKTDVKTLPETIIPPILSFNLHFEDFDSNLVLKALQQRENASQLTEILVSHLNWEEDPTRLSHVVGKAENVFDNERQNAVHKLLIEIFDSAEIARIFYYNDVRVLIDIIVTHLNNLLPGDKSRISYLQLALNIIKNTNYKEEPHKLEEVEKCLSFIVNDENSSIEEKQLTELVKQHLPAT
ncbi:DUF2013 domain containing protein-like protein, partial [Leptotrombidium deliense]